MVDFEGFYRGGPLVEGMPDVGVPWDIGGPQPAVVEWEAAGRFRGHVLDAGCGTGDNAIFLAARGHRVTGVDIAPTAIDIARSRAVGIDPDSTPSGGRAAPTPIIPARSDTSGDLTWAVGDAATLTGQFDTVLASALFHCLPPDRRPALARTLRNAAADGAFLNLTCLANLEAPFQVSEPELRTALTEAGWDITRFERGSVAVAGVPGLPTLPVWLVEATAAKATATATATTPRADPATPPSTRVSSDPGAAPRSR
ncbi:hypothetical protein ADL03_31535 [Nocardia sp. NRRL S-836]|nr:hypothetical protein ADL03_31535 [Nocardia sp. NRRL S-836]